jgi:hypothetical protein
MKKCIWMVCLGLVFSSFALAAEEKNKAVQPAKPSLTVVLVKPQQASMLESVLANVALTAIVGLAHAIGAEGLGDSNEGDIVSTAACASAGGVNVLMDLGEVRGDV